MSSIAPKQISNHSNANSVPSTSFSPDLALGLNLAPSALLLLDANACVVFINQAAEQLFALPLRHCQGQPLRELFLPNPELEKLLRDGIAKAYGERSQEIALARPGAQAMVCQAFAAVLDSPYACLVLDFRALDQRLRLDREARHNESAQANRELIRNLAHEIKNPLGGIRGAAQLLEMDLANPAHKEFTQVVIKEADRLQNLVDRLLAPHRHARSLGTINIHEVCERVRSVLLAEYPSLTYKRDYDASIPEFQADKERMIQVLLNLVQNAAQALKGVGEITVRTRIARKVILHQEMHKLALELHVVDNGPGIPEELQQRMFFPLVSGREGGSGLGLSLAQTFVHQHGGTITCESKPGVTDFSLILPLQLNLN